jgi:predicted GIY-YIG superfamily endonuclease
MKQHILYKLTFPNGKVYIGQTVNFSIRMRGHKNDSFNPNRFSRNCQVNNAIRKYGWENVKTEIIFECSENEIDILEKKYIKLFDSTNRNFGYNREGGGNSKKTVSMESRKLISASRKGKRNWGKKVAQIDIRTNKIVKVWECIADAARNTGASPTNISVMCNNKKKICYVGDKKYVSSPLSVGGFKWRFIQHNVLTLA